MKPFILTLNNKRNDNIYILLTADDETGLEGITINKITKLNNGITKITGDTINSGRIYFIASDTIPTELPSPNDDNYYTWIEFSKLISDCDCKDNCKLWINLTNVDLMGLQLGLSATDNCGNSFTCGYKSGATETIKHLSNLFPKAVVKTSNGKNKVLAPDTAPSGSYKPFDDYIDTIVKANVSMTIKSDSQIGFNPQIFNGSFTDGDIIVSLKDDRGNTFEIPKSGLTTDIIYKCDGGNLYYNGKLRPDNLNPKTVSGKTAQDYIVGNSLFRDIVTAINEGYFTPGQHYDNTNLPKTPFINGNGNEYAKEVHQCSNSYGFPYSDGNLKVLLTADVTKDIIITLYDDDTTAEYSPNLKPSCSPTVFCFDHTFSFGAESSLGEIKIDGEIYKEDPTSKTYQGILKDNNEWVKMYISGDSKYIIFNTETNDVKCSDIIIDIRTKDSKTPTILNGTWDKAPYGWSLSFPAYCTLNPNGTNPIIP